MTGVGILGGSFDPVHSGHLRLGLAFAAALELEVLRFVPAGQPWQKSTLKASPAQRLAMLQRAVDSLPRQSACRFGIDTRELQRDGPSYSVDTLTDLRAELGPRVAIVLLLGADQLLRLDTWQRWRDLFGLAHIAVATRPGFALADVPAPVRDEWQARQGSAADLHATAAGRTFLLDGLAMDVSASNLRGQLMAQWQTQWQAHQETPETAQLSQNAATAPAAQGDLQNLLPAAVLDYIRSNNLYQD